MSRHLDFPFSPVAPPQRERQQLLPTLTSLIALSCVLAASLVTPLLAATPHAEWRTLRHDDRNSRTSPGVGNLSQPVTRWRVRIGGRVQQLLAADATLNDRDDLIALVAGAVSARRWDGAVLWKTAAMGAVAIMAIDDLDGDGIAEVIVRAAREVRVLSLLSGAEIWRSDAGAFDRLTFVAVEDFDGDGVADLALANDGGFNEGVYGDTHVFGFVGGVKERFATAKQGPYGAPVHAGSQAALDIDGDGLPDLLNAASDASGKGWIYALSGKTGALLAQSTQIQGLRCVGRYQLAGGAVLCVSPAKSEFGVPGVAAFKREGKALVQTWSWAHPDPVDGSVTWIGSHDLDQDNKLETVLFGRGVGLVVLDTQTGAPLGSPFWLAKLGDVGAGVVALVRGVGAPTLIARGITSDPAAPGPTELLTWSRVGGFQHAGSLGVGVLATPRLTTGAGFAPPTATSLGGGANVAWLVDTDQDGLVDTVATKTLTVVASKTPAQPGTHTFASVGTMPFQALGGGLLWLRNGGSGALALRTWDDAVQVRDESGLLLNDGDSDGRADLAYGGNLLPEVRVGWLNATDVAPRILVGLPGRLLALDPTNAGPAHPPSVTEVLRSGADPMVGVPLDGDGDGSREVVVQYRPVGQGVRVQSLSLGGTPGKPAWQSKWTWAAADAGLRAGRRDGPILTIVDADGDGAEDLLMGMRRADNGAKGGLRLISGKTGKLAWKADAAAIAEDGYAWPPVILPSKDGPVILQSLYSFRFRYSLADGAKVGSYTEKQPRYGIPKVVDVNDDGVPEVLITGGAHGIGLEDGGDHASLWLESGVAWQSQASAVFRLNNEAVFATLLKSSTRVEVRKAKTGTLLWSLVYSDGKASQTGTGATTLANLVAVQDLAGDGKPALLFASATGLLYAVDAATGAVLWVRNYRGTIGAPVVADVDGDGAVEIVVPMPDGFIEVLDTNQLGTIAWVRDNDGTGPALSDAADIDAQDASDVLHANWAALAGAQGYAVRVLSQDGAEVVPWADVGLVTATSVSKLSLQVGLTYVVEVRAYGGASGKTSFSAPTSTDGVKIVDTEAPTISRLLAVPAVIPSDHAGTTLEIDAQDATRLSLVACAIHVDTGLSAPGMLEGSVQRKVAEKSVTLQLGWDGRAANGGALAGPGKKVVICTVTDVAGHTAVAETTLLICEDGFTAAAGACVSVLRGDADAGASGTSTRLNGEEVDGCGCAVQGGRDRLPSPGSVGLLLLCLGLVLRVRSARRRALKLPAR